MRSTSGMQALHFALVAGAKTLAINLLINAVFLVETSAEAPGFGLVNRVAVYSALAVVPQVSRCIEGLALVLFSP